jgi:hypothetical protein
MGGAHVRGIVLDSKQHKIKLTRPLRASPPIDQKKKKERTESIPHPPDSFPDASAASAKLDFHQFSAVAYN